MSRNKVHCAPIGRDRCCALIATVSPLLKGSCLVFHDVMYPIVCYVYDFLKRFYLFHNFDIY